MKAEEKAKELYEKYSEVIFPDMIDYNKGMIIRHCLICVDDILKSFILELYNELVEHIDSLEFTSDDGFVNEEKIKYWEEVKQEIQNL